MTLVEQQVSRISGIMDEMRYGIHPDNERLLDCLDRLEMAIQDLEQEAVSLEERLKDTQVRKVA